MTDENGTILAQNISRDRKDVSWSNGSGYYEIFEFAGIKPDVMKILDTEKTKIMITKLLLIANCLLKQHQEPEKRSHIDEHSSQLFASTRSTCVQWDCIQVNMRQKNQGLRVFPCKVL